MLTAVGLGVAGCNVAMKQLERYVAPDVSVLLIFESISAISATSAKM